MAHWSMRRRAALATAVSGAVAAALVSFTGPGATATAGHAEPRSTPVPIATPDGVVSSYLLNARVANPGIPRARPVRRARHPVGDPASQRLFSS